MTYYKKIKSYSENMLKLEIEQAKSFLEIEQNKDVRSKLNLLTRELQRREKQH
jgi:hypothetical protein